MVGVTGFEPVRLTPRDFKSLVYTVPPHAQSSGTTRGILHHLLLPVNRGNVFDSVEDIENSITV